MFKFKKYVHKSEQPHYSLRYSLGWMDGVGRMDQKLLEKVRTV